MTEKAVSEWATNQPKIFYCKKISKLVDHLTKRIQSVCEYSAKIYNRIAFHF
jgi:hypothetical protein